MMDKAPKKNFLSFQIDPARFAPATDAEKAQQLTQRESTSFMRDAMRRLRARDRVFHDEAAFRREA